MANTLPVADGLPFVGSLFQMAKEAQFFFYEQHLRHGNAFKVRTLGREFNVIAGINANIFAATTPDALTAWDTWEALSNDFGARRVIAMVDGPEHARFRRLMRQSFSREAIERNIDGAVGLIASNVHSQALNTHIHVADLMQHITADVLGMLSNHRLPGGYFQDIVQWWSTLVAVYLAHVSPRSELSKRTFVAARARVREFVEAVIAERLALGNLREQEDGDFIDNLLAASTKDPDFLSRDEVLFHALSGYFAGLDTVANVTSFMLYELLRHPGLLAAARAEADVVFANGTPEAIALRSMKVTHAVALETLRLYPIAGTLMRNAACDFEFEGHQFRKGEPIIVATAAPHFDPTYFPNPKRFDIERYAPPRNEHRVRGAYAPFGAGAHTCLGAGLAEVQIMLTIAVVLRHADFTLDPPGYELKFGFLPSLTPKGFGIKIQAWRDTVPQS